MKKTLIALFLIAVLCLSLFACKSNPISANTTEAEVNPLVGRWVWEYEGLGEVMAFTFNEDNSGSFSVYGESLDYTYTYSDTEIALVTEEGLETVPYKLNGSTLTLDVDGEEVELVKKDSSDPANPIISGGDETEDDSFSFTEGTAAPVADMKAHLAELGIDESMLLLGSEDYLEMDGDGDFTLFTSAEPAEVARAIFDTCAAISDDGKVRDYWSEEEMEFTFNEDDFMTWYAYIRDGEFTDVAFSKSWTDPDTGVSEYLLQWG